MHNIAALKKNIKHFAFLLQALRHMTQRTISTASRRQMANRVPEYQKIFQVLIAFFFDEKMQDFLN